MNPTPGPSGSRGVKPPTQSSAVSSSSGRKKQPKKQKKTTTGFFPMKSEPEAEDGPVEPEKVIIDDEEEQLGVAETFTAYKPSKWKIGEPHPDLVVETSTMAAVEAMDISYEYSPFRRGVVEKGALSCLQLEAIAYAGQVHGKFLPSGERAGFLLGDGAGVGKGRTVAGIVLDNFASGRKKAVWISVAADLRHDAKRDFKDIGAEQMTVCSVTDFKYEKITFSSGVMFSTYSALIGHSSKVDKTRVEQIVKWCGGPQFEGVIIFDECHRAKNLVPKAEINEELQDGKFEQNATKTGIAVYELQKMLPKARVVYASATGASEPRHMSYMVRLGLWGKDTPFRNYKHFHQSVQKKGVGVMEVVACDMKLRGIYLARQLSFKGVTFRVDEALLSADMLHTYNSAAKLWTEALEMFEEVLPKGDGRRGVAMSQFWSAHQRFFKYMCIHAKVHRAIQIAREALAEGKCVVIGLQSTGEARTLQALPPNGEFPEIISTAKLVFESVVKKFFPETSDCEPAKRHSRSTWSDHGYGAGPSAKRRRIQNSSESSNSDYSSWEGTDTEIDMDDDDDEDYDPYDDMFSDEPQDNPVPVRVPKHSSFQLGEMKKRLLRKIEFLGEVLPPNTLDYLIEELGGPSQVAEMTGRKGRVVRSILGDRYIYEPRASDDLVLSNVNMDEKEKFMDGKKLVAIISEAASLGISLQSDRRVRNQRRRVHITLELPWSADKAIQQFGRTHRSNQVNAPEYVLLISQLAGERRFASTVSKRLEQLGALTHGDRRSTEVRDLSGFNFETKYGASALRSTLEAVNTGISTVADQPADKTFLPRVKEALENLELKFESNTIPVSRFLNRILGLPVNLQNPLFSFFTETMDKIIAEAKRFNKFDNGIRDLGGNGTEVKHVESLVYHVRNATDTSKIELHTVLVERGMTWEEAVEILKGATTPEEGFYITNSTNTIYLGILNDKGDLCIFRPNLGFSYHSDISCFDDLRKSRRLVTPAVAMYHWQTQYDFALHNCSHKFRGRLCSEKELCGEGLRKRKCYILTGALLSIWVKIEAILKTKLQVVRVNITEGDRKLVGVTIPGVLYNDTIQMLVSLSGSDKPLQFDSKIA